MSAAENYKRIAQINKAKALTKQIDGVAADSGIDPFNNAGDVVTQIIDRLTLTGWAWLAKSANVHMPSSETIEIIRADYLERQRVSDAVRPSNVYRLRPNSVERVGR